MTEQIPTPRGLSAAEVERSRRTHGENTYHREAHVGFWRRFVENLGDPVIKVLLCALAVNLLLLFRNADWFQAAGIAVSVFLATLISTLSEHGSEAAFARLFESCSATFCRVRRGEIREIPTAEVVVGDLVLLDAGEKIPADGVLVAGTLRADQSALTGESREVEKNPIRYAKRIQDIKPTDAHALFAGSTVLSGDGEMEVLRVGDATLLGGISGEVRRRAEESPLKRRLTRLAAQISRVGYAAAFFCVLAFLFHNLVLDAGFSRTEILARLTNVPYLIGLLLSALTLGLTVVVVAVPEGLPMMIAVVLSSNIRRMIKDGVLVRKPAGIEAAGSMNILFTDKTGTLTCGRLSLCAVITAQSEAASTEALRRRAPVLFEWVRRSAYANCGAAAGVCEGRPSALGGNMTDRALLTAFLPFGAPPFALRERVAFDSRRKFAAAALTDGCVFVTGAPERLLPQIRAALDDEGRRVPFARAAFLKRLYAHTQKGERVILLCTGQSLPRERIDTPLVLLCAIAFCDPPRPEAARAVEALSDAGVQVVMMTGDGKETATRIARDCGILHKDGICLDGEELARCSDEELLSLLPRLCVIARAMPADKSRLVRLSKRAGLVVGMTGDGINDAPALKSADVGFAMGSGTSVAKEAGDVVILDDNLASITRAVLYGRTVFKSIRKFITLQLVMNFCAVGISIIGPFIGFDTPVTVVQMLWLNIIMDTLGGLAFAGEAPSPRYLREPPKRRDEPILTRAIVGRMLYLTVCSVSILVFFLCSPHVKAIYHAEDGTLRLLTAFFVLFIFLGVLNCFNARSDRVRMLADIGKNKTFLPIMLAVCAVQIGFVYLGGSVLRTVPLTGGEMLRALAYAFLILPVGLLQLVFRRLCRKGGIY